MPDWGQLGAALALVCVIEGLMPFVNPAGMRRLFAKLLELNDRELRLGGLFTILAGLLLLFLVRS